MATNVLLVVHFRDVHGNPYPEFDAAMEDYGWEKINNVDMAWKNSFSPINEPKDIFNDTIKDCCNAAKQAGITKWYAVVMVGNHQPTEFNYTNCPKR